MLQAVRNLVAPLQTQGFRPQGENPQGPYPGWKICRVLKRAVHDFYGDGAITSAVRLISNAATPATRQLISNAVQNTQLKVGSGWHANFTHRPEYYHNALTPYGFQALELRVPGVSGGRVYVGVTDNVKNKSGVSAICVVGFQMP
jgi:hypothetical protein